MRLPQSPPAFQTAVQHLLADPKAALLIVNTVELPDAYLHWDELRHRDPPAGLDHERWWAVLRLRRAASARPFSVLGAGFSYNLPDEALELLRRIDQACGQQVGVVSPDRRFRDRATFLANARREEAVQSSLLEGAATTRLIAKEMLRTGRPPLTTGERMIRNNHEALTWVAERQGEPLTLFGLQELHRVITRETVDPLQEGRVQQPGDERVAVVDRVTGTLLHRPPPAAELPQRLESLCAFCRGEGPWLHPIVRACLAHFALAWLHPFYDGNGRLARSLFYLVAKSNGYWPVEYLPISRRLREAPQQYARAFLHTESDGGDITYFLLHHLRVLSRALDDFHAYAERKEAEGRSTQALLHERADLNHRQHALLQHALRHPQQRYTIKSHQNSHRVAYATARADLLGLVEGALLVQGQRGRAMVFTPAPALAELLQGR